MVELRLHKVAARVNSITNFQLDDEVWSFGLEPFHRGNRASQVSIRMAGTVSSLLSSLFIRSIRNAVVVLPRCSVGTTSQTARTR